MKIPCRTCAGEPTRPSPWWAGPLCTVLSAATLIFLPKCPLCIASYLAAATGIGISVGAASHLRTGAMIFCYGILAFLSLQFASRLLRPLKTQGKNPA